MNTIKTLLSISILLLSALDSQAEIWEKEICCGLTCRTEIDYSTPRIIHALRYSVNTPQLILKAALANKVIFDLEPQHRGLPLSSIIKRENAVAGINAGFFPIETKVPIGAMIQNGKLLKAPYSAIPNRSVFGWGSGYSELSKLQWKATLTPQGMNPINITGYNDVCVNNSVILNTKTSGKATAKSQASFAYIRLDNARLTPTGKWEGTFLAVYNNLSFAYIPKGQIVIAAHGAGAIKLAQLKPGHKVTLEMETKGLDWSKVQHAVCGGPNLCKDGRIDIDATAQKFRRDIVNGRAPRTAMGRTQNGDIWLVTVDGRNVTSVGASLEEMAQIMLQLGCIDAMNLDGGGSTTFNLYGTTYNKPSDYRERKIANALIILKTDQDEILSGLKIEGPKEINIQGLHQYDILNNIGQKIPHEKVHWTSNRNAMINPIGQLKVLKQGPIKLTAHVYGNKLEININPVCKQEVLIEPLLKDNNQLIKKQVFDEI